MPSFVVRAAQAAHYLFAGGYDATKSNNRRKSATGVLRSEDSETSGADRAKLQSGIRDLRRNFSVMRWLVNRHLDYVTSFTFQATTTNRALNKKIEAYIRQRSKRENYDYRGRHSLRSALRIAEASRVIDGDVLNVRMANGCTQWIEGDRICKSAGVPGNIDPTYFTHGVLEDKGGRAKAYAVHSRGRNGTGLTFERLVPAYNAYLHGYIDRFDQTRGISPLAAAANELQDAYEGLDMARAKMKVSQLFAFALYRDEASGGPPTKQTADGPVIDFGKGPQFLDLKTGDKAEFMQSPVQSAELASFLQATFMVAMKALDIPYSFYNESFTNYSGSRGAMLQYQRACESKQDSNREYLDWWTEWQLTLGILSGELAGVTFEDLRWSWIARAVPAMDALKERLADIQAIGAGLETRTRLLRAEGLDFEDIVAELKFEAELLRDAGLPLNIDEHNALITAITTEEAKQEQQNADATEQVAA